MYKILRILNRFNLGGPSYNVALLSKYISEKYQTRIVGGPPQKEETGSFFIFDNLKLSPTVIPEMQRSISIKNDWLAYKKLSRIIKEYHPDIVHTHVARAGILGRIVARRNNVPIIVHTFHGHHFSGYTNQAKIFIYKQLEKYLSSISSAIITISEKQKEELTQIYKVVPEEKCYVVPLGFDLSKFVNISEEKIRNFRETFQIPKDKIIISIIGRFAPVKNHPLLIEAVSLLPGHLQEKIRVIVVGDGDSKENLQKLIRAKGMSYGQSGENLFVFTSWQKDVSGVLGISDISVLTSLNEGTPVSLIEALAAKVPVISTDVGGVKNVVADGQSGLLVPSQNAKKLAEALQTLILSPGKRKSFGEYGQKKILKKYSYTRLVKDMENIYEELLRKHKSKINIP